jgi:uncharacterized protein DUF5677
VLESDPLAEYNSALKIIRDVSREAYDLYHRLIPQQSTSSGKEHWNLVTRSVAVAESTSAAILSLIDQRYHLPALALTRVRFEQTVVLSYLLHEKPDMGFKPYARFAPITEYQVAEGVTADPLLAPHVPIQVDMAALKKKALDAQWAINPGFDIKNGKFQSKWTTLDLYSMALRRDKLAANSGWLISQHLPFANLYTALYKTGSSPVHADGSMLVPPLWGPVTGADGHTQTDASILWALALPAYVTHYDVLECYEALRWAGVNVDQEFVALTQKLIA